MSDITDLREAYRMLTNHCSGHGHLAERLWKLADRIEAELTPTSPKKPHLEDFGDVGVKQTEAPAHPEGYADDGVAMMAHHKFGHALPWIIDMRRRGYSVELDLQVHVSTIGGTPEVDQVLGGLRFTKNVQVVL